MRAILLLGAAVAMIVHAVAGTARPVAQLLIVAAPLVSFGYALATRRLPRQRPWLLAMGGLVLLVVGQLSWPDQLSGGHLGKAEGSAADFTLFAAHGLFLMGTAIALRRRLAADAGGLIDAAVLGLCAGGPVWVWAVEPHLTEAATSTGEMLLMVDVFAICGVIGCLIRMAAARAPGRATMTYLAATAVFTLAALTAGWSTSLLLAFVTIAAVPLQRDVAAVTEPQPVGEPSRRSGAHLVWLAAALGANPLLTVVQILRGSSAATLMLAVGTLLVIPLVLLRFHRLTTQREQAERTLAHQASHDELTGLRNRRHMMAEIDRALAGPDGVTVLLCDLDGFKPINDRYGHQTGDEALRVVAARLTAVVRPGDVVGRLGGDEFLIVTHGPEPAGLADRIRESLRSPMALTAGSVTVGVTVGTASAPPAAGLSREDLVARADAAMYAGKPARAA
ncbi:GGDEF domain-containing protein [Actinoplanes sp. DH11]|uniref:GGDEF domain-containing protein n=1 Tax=Actinoplanes sp. DH11 TaxID=2857011 RepID=UPI001E310942|nr:GGDEF domain-containing protein [Actinoplanes sp. DH11]